jgi:hypothetical protein
MPLTVKYIIAIIVAAFYLYYTVNYTLKFRKSKIYKGQFRVFHYIMFWLIPFVWVWLIKNLSKSTKGSHEIENKVDPVSFGGHYNA